MASKMSLLIFLYLFLNYASGNQIYAGVDDYGMWSSADDGRNWNVPSFRLGKTAVFASSAKVYLAEGGRQVNALHIWDGQNWTAITNLPKYYNPSSLLVTDNKIYLGTTNGLVISEDGGKTWAIKTTADGLGRSDVTSVAVVENNIYVGTNGGGLAISADGGKTWTIKTRFHGLGDAQVNSVFAVGKTIYAGTGSGLSISVDGGQVWTNKDQAQGFGIGEDYCNVAAVFVANNKIYASVSDYVHKGHLYTSGDGGKTWLGQDYRDGLCTSPGSSLFVLGQEIYAGCWDNEYLMSISRDNGQTWSTIDKRNSGSMNRATTSISVTP